MTTLIVIVKNVPPNVYYVRVICILLLKSTHHFKSLGNEILFMADKSK